MIRTLTPTFPTISTNGVTNAASFATRISPGALASVFGTGFGTSTYLADDGRPLAHHRQLGQREGQRRGGAPVLCFAGADQLPGALGHADDAVPSTSPCWSTAAAAISSAVAVGTAAPGLFYDPTSGAAIVQNTPDYSLNTAANPAPAGSTIVAYLTGSGPVSPATKDGTLAPTDGTLIVAHSVVTRRRSGPRRRRFPSPASLPGSSAWRR